MRPSHLGLVLCTLALAPTTASAQDSLAARVQRILESTPLVDGHNDLPGLLWDRTRGDLSRYDLRGATDGDTDWPRMRRGRVGGQFWSVYVSVDEARPAVRQLEQIDIARRMIAAYPDELELALTADEVERPSS